MNREEYLIYLETKNSYCACPELETLYEKRRQASKLEEECDLFRAEGNPDIPQESDRQFLNDYIEKIAELRTISREYHILADQFSQEGKLKLRLHDSKQLKPVGDISSESIRALLEEDQIITIHCGECDQQIDIAD
jgi:hypothetical protein